MNHPYRIVITNGAARYAVLTLCRVYNNAMPTRVRDPSVEKVILQVRVPLPRDARVQTGVCMPPCPDGQPISTYERELQKLYDLYNALVAAPAESLC